MSEIINAVVKRLAGRVVKTTYGERITILVSLPEGKEATLWANPGEEPYVSLQAGQNIQLVKDKRGYKLVSNKISSPPPKEQQEAIWTDGYKNRLKSKVAQHTKLLRHCLNVSKNQFNEFIQGEQSLAVLATSLYSEVLKE